ncbi:MAG TPA: helix-turn-helix transcriptional regulator [Candidatus Angelobacter sp.]|jgi:transcriptional regulator with XRE-family HTH domain|nr:helix-turn-helix transcriptional regulator [Candidatus Angelobacter sp.]
MPKQSRSLARMSAAQQRLGKKIRGLRERQGLSQEALADLCELNRVHIGGIEQGKINLTLATLDKVARNLKTTCATLLRGIL